MVAREAHTCATDGLGRNGNIHSQRAGQIVRYLDYFHGSNSHTRYRLNEYVSRWTVNNEVFVFLF